MIADPNKIKCSICYKATSPTGQASYASIRFCPSCSRAMHVQCTNQWAKNSPDATDEVFRCPFCYYLLRNSSASVIAALTPQAKAGGKKGSTTFMLVPAADVPDINQSCAQCHVIFMGEHDVYKCESCGSYYHQPCVKDIQAKYGACKVCGRSIKNVSEIVGK
jgi:DNA-directed RNA polymerase subunit M/transcription elongation factor TFIIS